MIGNQDKLLLVINLGSSSLKFRLYNRDKIIEDKEITTDKIGFKKAAEKLYDTVKKYKIKKFAYRVVYGDLPSPTIINKKVLQEIIKFRELDPLHTEKTFYIIKFLMKKFGGEHIACFDSTFHRTMPKKAKKYAIPKEISDKYKIIRYGFHGIAHESLYKDAEKFMGKKYKRIISCQLGSGVSLCAIKDGKSIDTTMGFTPLEGIMMETRSGNIDPAIIPFLNKKNLSVKRIKDILEKESGLLGVSGFLGVKEVVKNMKKNSRAKLAFEMFVYEVRKAIGGYMTALGKVDLIVLGGGISRSVDIRKRILEDLEEFGIKINKIKVNKKSPVKISTGKIDVVVLETDEQKHMLELVKRGRFFK